MAFIYLHSCALSSTLPQLQCTPEQSAEQTYNGTITTTLHTNSTCEYGPRHMILYSANVQKFVCSGVVVVVTLLCMILQFFFFFQTLDW